MFGFGVAEHVVLLAMAELDKGDGVSEDNLVEYCNTHLVNLTVKELHERIKKINTPLDN